MDKYPHLFSPITIAGHTYKNRILSAPMTFGFMIMRGKEAAERQYRVVEGRAMGGVAEVVVGETPINYSDAPDFIFPGSEVDYTSRSGPGFEAYKRYADLIKKHDTIALIQIFHAGHAKDPIPFGKRDNPWGPMGYVRKDGVTVEAFDAEKMAKVRGDYVTCAEFMKAAGFDGVLIHGAHGFLFTQFLSPANRRTDEYGGILENRGRFPREILGDIRKRMGPGFIIELRINGADLVEGGIENEEVAEFCSTLDGLVDIIHVSSGHKSKGHDTEEFSSMYHPHGVNVERAANIKKKTRIPVTVVGGINNPEYAERIIAEGKVDFVSIARQMIADPDFAIKTKAGKEDEIRRCLRCYHCYTGMPEVPGDDRARVVPDMSQPIDNLPRGPMGTCTINPRAGNEVEIERMPEPKGSRNVLVVGGGPGGMQAAITAFDRGHRVTLAEKKGYLGGLLRFTDTDAHKYELRDFKDLLVREVKRRDIRVLLNTEATPGFVVDFKPDVLILAIGAVPCKPPIPGLDTAMHALDVYEPDCAVGKKIVMVGGGLAGCETALHLADKGHEVVIIEMLDRLAPEAYGLALTATIRQIEKRSNITAKTGVKCVEVVREGVKIENSSGKAELIAGDSVVYSLGMNARREETERLRAAAGEATVFEAGDCIRGAKVYEAVSEGFMAAMKIL